MSNKSNQESPVPHELPAPLHNHKLLLQMMDNCPDGMKLLDLDGMLLWMNLGGIQASEREDGTTAHHTFWPGMWPGEGYSMACAALEKAGTGQVANFQGYCPTAKGVPRWWDVTVLPLPEDNLPFQFLHVICRDITAQHDREVATARLEAVVNSSADAIIGFDPEGRIVTWNGGAERMFGYTAREAIGQTYALIGTSDVYTLQSTIFADIMRGVTHHQYHTRRRRKDGVVLDVAITTSPLVIEGRISGASATVRDITEQKRLAEDLRHRTAMLDALINGARSAIYMKDTQGRFLLANPMCLELLGRKLEEVLGCDDTSLFPPDIAEAMRQTDAAIMQSETGRLFEEFAPVQGKMHTFLSAKNPLFDAEGKVIGIIGISQDITDLKQHEAEIEALNVRLQQAMQETHHRVKNNLQVISALVEMQVSDSDGVVPASALTRIGQHTRALAGLHDLLTQHVRANQRTEALSTREILDKLLPLLQATIGKRPLVCEADDAPLTLDQSASFALLTSELISNAVKHGKGNIEISLQREPMRPPEQERRALPRLRLEVRDDGPGFPANFDAVKAANTGLELIDHLTHWDLRGKIFYMNRASGGACVRVSFPFREEAAPLQSTPE